MTDDARPSRRLVLGSVAATAASASVVSAPVEAADESAQWPAGGPLSVERLTVEYADEPLGIDVERPRLAWIATAPGYGATQSAYQVIVASRPELLKPGQADVWDSGKVETSRSIGVQYGGPALTARTRYHWRVRLWDGRGRVGAWSKPAWFETGLLDEGFGSASWIGATPAEVWDLAGASWIWTATAPAGSRWFRHRASVPAGVTSARLVATADDDFTLWLNGEQVLSAPQRTDGWRVAQTADVTHLIGTAITFAAAATNHPGPSVNPAGLLVKLVLDTPDGPMVVTTDNNWRVFETEVPGWTAADFDDSGWPAATAIAPYGQGPWGSDVAVNREQPAPLLRRAFTLAKPVTRARLYACGLAYQDLRINGKRVGNAVLDPGFTDYDHTLLYVTHDVTGLLRKGENALGAELGRGFFGLTTPNVWRWHQAPWNGEPRLIARLVVDHPDGTTTEIRSDQQWRVTNGPTVSNSLFSGETYDARLLPKAWDTAGFDDAAWTTVASLPAPRGTLTAQQHEPIRVIETVAQSKISALRPGVWVVDFGRTTAGWTRLRVAVPAGTKVSLRYGETLREDGTVAAENPHVQVARFQLDEFIAAGNGVEEWEPRFSYKGFRYVQVEGVTEQPGLVMRVAHSDVREVTSFSASRPRYELLEKTMRRTVLNNLHGIPTDTPTYEKNGWTGDAQVGAPTMAATLDMARFFTKWLSDLRDSQVESGQLPVIVPSGGWGYRELAPATEWTTVYPFVLREMHRWYGDERLLAEHWEPVLRYLDWELGRVTDGLSPTVLGDWIPPGSDGPPPEDPRITATSYLHRALIAIAEVGELTGRGDDASRLRQAAAGLKAGLNAAFLDTTRGLYRTARDPGYRQTSNAVPLAFGLVPDEFVPRVVENLVADITARGDHLNTGCLGVVTLLPVLTRYGHADVAAKLALQRTYPSWGYWLDSGADTMWEMWETTTRSRNHYFHGTVAQWLLENVAGVRNAAGGWQRLVIRPDARSQVTWAALKTDTVRGRVAASWRQTGRVLHLEAQIPVGATAEIHVPAARAADVSVVPAPYAGPPRYEAGYAIYTVGSGHWHFVTRSA
ncbi:family 78 glycoside hydrolase catalytic domain [Kribbella deserti]|uniref:alpha-L-rhamnosidase n=1 Tax=Kribbella deserti TaxID=1926257 RepID=A0ABV6QN68_9ACTN